MKVLHLTPHFGGGVGRALLAIAAHVNQGIDHKFICLEIPEKKQFINSIRDLGCKVSVAPSIAEIIKQIEECDIFQLEWWSHPATISSLCQLPGIPIRLLVWCHVSGLYGQIIPKKLLQSATRFLLTSACSYHAEAIKNLDDSERARLYVVPSTGGYDFWPESFACRHDVPLSVGYIGSLNFAKLHPDYVQFMASVTVDHFKVSVVGDLTNHRMMQRQAEVFKKNGMLHFVGYSEDVQSEFSKINVLAYLLNPTHYGTNENALLEAMAMGIVPVVLNNPAECEIVEHESTGIVVDSVQTFSEAIERLDRHPHERTELGNRAAESVKHRFTKDRMTHAFSQHYHAAVQEEKRTFKFSEFFGNHPADWFLACQQDKTIFSEDGRVHLPHNRFLYHALTETTKGSVIHFQRYFPQDLKLTQWAMQLSQ
jgi:L-malate glycosyltransferase